MFLLEAVAAVFILRWAIHWLAGVVLGLILVVALAVQGIWGPLAFLVAVVALVVWIIRRVARLDSPVRPVRDLAAGYSSDNGYHNSRGGLRADFGARLDRNRRWSTR
jgi:hypothetical protein